MNRLSIALLLGLLGLLLAFVPACGEGESQGEGQAGAPSSSAAEDALRAERRAKEAQRRFAAARGEIPARKAAALSEVAHLYWDTEGGAQAVVNLVSFLCGQESPDAGAALEEVKVYRRAAGDVPAAVSAAQIVAQHLITRLDIDDEGGPTDAERPALEALRKEALGLWEEVAGAVASSAAYGGDAKFHRGLGEARQLRGDYEGALKAWAAVEALDPAPSANVRVEILIMRASLLKYQLTRVDEARALYLEARSLLGKLDPDARRHYGNFISEEIGE
jgi:tetratricopeptide (TPR) repeat protein